jgi:hypothetical protein
MLPVRKAKSARCAGSVSPEAPCHITFIIERSASAPSWMAIPAAPSCST